MLSNAERLEEMEEKEEESSKPAPLSQPEPTVPDIENPLYCKECDLVLQTQQSFASHLTDPNHVRKCIENEELNASEFRCRCSLVTQMMAPLSVAYFGLFSLAS